MPPKKQKKNKKADEDFPEIRAAAERMLAEVWKDEPEGYWESSLKDPQRRFIFILINNREQ